MMLAYQPVRSSFKYGYFSGTLLELLPIIDEDNDDKNNCKHLEVKEGNISFQNVTFKYSESLKMWQISLEIKWRNDCSCRT